MIQGGLVVLIAIIGGIALGMLLLALNGERMNFFISAPKKRSKAIPRGTAPRKRGRPKKEQAVPDATPLDL